MRKEELEKLVREYEGMCYIHGMAVAIIELVENRVVADGLKEYGNGKLIIPWFVHAVGETMGRYMSSGKVKVVVIEEGVEVIKENAFRQRGGGIVPVIERIYIPDSIRYIHRYAFEKLVCEGVRVPTGVLSIGEGAFAGSSVDKVVLKSDKCVVGDKAFYGCDRMTGVFIGKGVQGIGEKAFDKCRSLTMVIAEDGSVKNKFSERFAVDVMTATEGIK